MKRIALIRNSYSFHFGGAEMFPINLARVLNQNGYETFVLSSNNKVLSIAKAAKLNTKNSPWWSFQNFSGLYILAFPIYLFWIIILTGWYLIYLVKNRIDIVCPQSRDDFIAATFAATLSNKGVLWMDHADLKYVFMNLGIWYKNPVGKLTYLASKLADCVSIESFSEKRLIEAALGKKLPSKFLVNYIGVIDSYKPVKRNDDKLVLISTSRLVTAKGIGELIKAMELVDDTNVVLKICGDGPEAAHFKAMAKDANNIEFLGHVENVNQLLRNSDVLVHPSYHESFGLSLIEAEMCGLPIIASAVDSIPEIVKDGVSGILVPPKSIKELADAIQILNSDPKLRASMGKAGRQLFLHNFQLDKIVKEQLIPLYNEIA